MRRIGFALLLAAGFLRAQVPPSPAEEQSLSKALGDAGNSSVEILHAFENHLKQFPNSPRKAELERALAKTAIDLNDDGRTIRYGEIVLASDPDNLQILQHVTTALLRQNGQADAQRALDHARRIEQLIQATYQNDKFAPGGGPEEVRRKEEYDRGLASARVLQARAQGLLGHTTEAVQLAQSSYQVFPSVEGAREAARWLSSAGRDPEAIQYLADAFTIAGLRSAEPDGANDRARMSELYRKLNGSEAGLGDLILKAYDNTSNALAARRDQMREYDPNSQIKDPLQFTLSGLDGDKLKLSSLLGKVLVLDFWATWCVPCRAQHPLYEQVKAAYKDSGDVVFLSVDAGEDKSVVRPFVEQQKWNQKIYFEDGLQGLLQVSSIPTTVIFGRKGEVVSRMIGFLPGRFVGMLTERIDDALGKTQPAPPPQDKPNGTTGNPASP